MTNKLFINLVGGKDYGQFHRGLCRVIGMEEAIIFSQICECFDMQDKDPDTESALVTVNFLEGLYGLSEQRQRRVLKSLESIKLDDRPDSKSLITCEYKSTDGTCNKARFIFINCEVAKKIIEQDTKRQKELKDSKNVDPLKSKGPVPLKPQVNKSTYKQVISTTKNNNKEKSIETRELRSQFYPHLFSISYLSSLVPLKEVVGYDVLDYLEKVKVDNGILEELFNSVTYTIEQGKPIHNMFSYCKKIIDSYSKGCKERKDTLDKMYKNIDNQSKE